MANVFDPEFADRPERPPGYEIRAAQVAKAAGAERLGATLYELAPGQSICPYHWHAANEEMMIVLRGRVLLRTPEGERELGEGALVAFPVGEPGAHKVTGAGADEARVLMISEMNSPEIAGYPDSGKVMVREQPPGTAPTGLRAILRLDDQVDYWEGEERPRRE